MSLLLKQLFQLVHLLNSETATKQIAAGVAAGFILGMTPVFSLQTILLIFCVVIFRIQIGAVIVSAFFFAFPAFLLDGLFHRVGHWFLNLSSLESLFTQMYNMPILPFTRFNNTVVMGSGIVAILLSPIVFFLAIYLVDKYRKTVVERVRQTKFWKALQSTKIYKWYYQYAQYEW